MSCDCLPRISTTILLFVLISSLPFRYFDFVSSKQLTNNSQPNLKGENSPLTRSLNQHESIRILYCGRLPSFNPLTEYDFLYPIMSVVYDPLISIDPDTGEMNPSLVKQWVVTNDSKEWTLYLREDVIFHNGFQFNAVSVKETVDMVISRSVPEFPIDSCEILGEFIVRLKMTQSANPFYLTFPSIAYKPNNLTPINLPDEITDYIPEGGIVWPVGTGPYKLENYTVEEKFVKFVFSRFEDHFRGLAPFERIDYFFFFDPLDYENAVALQEGELAERYASEFNQEYWELAPRTEFTFIGIFNTTREELRDPRVRQALNYALNRTSYISENFGRDYGWIEYELLPAKILIPKVAEFDDSKYGYPYNLVLAEQLLDQAGYPRNGDGYRFDLSIVGLPFHGFIKDWLIYSFESIGIRCSFDLGPFGVPFTYGSYDIATLDLVLGNTYFDLLHSNGVQNLGNYSYTKLDFLTYREKQTPVRQEKEFFEPLILDVCQEQAPYLLILNIRLGYIKAKSISSLVHQVPLGVYSFNYTSTKGSAASCSESREGLVASQSKPNTMNNVFLSSKSLYFPFTDNILRANQDMVVSTTLTTNIQNFLPTLNLQGKFYVVEVSKQDIDYSLRCYYDPEDIPSLESDRITVYKWDEEAGNWSKLIPSAFNTSLKYVEVNLKGDCIVRLGNVSEVISEIITYTFLPVVSVFVVGMMTAIVITLVYNQRTLKYLLRKEEP